MSITVSDTTSPAEFDQPPGDPVALLQTWFSAAKEQDVREPGAMVLATTGAEGRSSARIVMLTGITADGPVFTSHDISQKGRELARQPWASGVLFWRETRQQITLAGPVRRLSEARSDEMWAARPASTYPMSAASRQSEPLAGEEALRTEAQKLAAAGDQVPRPPAWYGYELVPDMVEFWLEGRDRLHKRLRYDRTRAGWTSCRLQP
jgi:pyridoxamine 5'-phosphate oxidase